MIKETVEQYNEALAEFTKKKAEAVALLKANFFNLLKPFFDAHPELTSIGWRQNYPWMDGAESYFVTHFDYILLNEEEEAEIDGLPLDLEGNIRKVLKSVPSNLYEDLFGRDITVTITREGKINTEEYYD